MNISGFQKQSLIDYPGKIASVVFTQGCNFCCPYCHNKQLIPLRKGQLSVAGTLEYFRKNKLLLDAVVITGGEPSLQKDLPEYISEIKKMGLIVKLDTNGTNPHLLARLFDKRLVDYVAMDIKSQFTEEAYSLACGIKISAGILAKIRESVDLIIRSEVGHEFRTTVCRELVSLEDIRSIVRELKGADRYFLQQYHSYSVEEKSEKLYSAYPENEMHLLIAGLSINFPVSLRE